MDRASIDRQSCGSFQLHRVLPCLGFVVAIVGLGIAAAKPLVNDQEPTAAARQAATVIREEGLRAHIKFLADDLLEGRGPGSRGDRLAQRYIATQFESLGLKPAAPPAREDWFQSVPLVGVTARFPDTVVFRKGQQELSLKYREEFIGTSGMPRPKMSVNDAELVFVGYGIVAPEYEWNDYKGADLRGKVLVMMNNDPAADPKLFAGKTRLYYGRWDYKYEIAAKQGAAGAIIIHTTPSAGYPWQVVQTSWTGEEFELQSKSGPRLQLRSWVTEEAARRIAELGGQDLIKLLAAAESRDFTPVPLGIKFSVDFSCDVREQTSANVLALIDGSDPKLRRELVVYTAHHDHLGLADEGAKGDDRIYNGAVDNASGVASLLTIARAFKQLPEPPARSILFAAVAAEEQGLLGSEHFAAHPLVPSGFMAATINIDGINIMGRTRDVNVIGHGKSDLDQILESVAKWQGRRVTPDLFPDRGFYYRSDQFNLAKIGVPGVYLHSGIDVIGRPSGWGLLQRQRWEATRYHQPSDEYEDAWDLSGAVEDTQLLFHVGLQVAQQNKLPEWKPGDEFEAARKAAFNARRDE